MRRCINCCGIVLCLLPGSFVHATQILDAIEITGLDKTTDAALRDNIMSSLSLSSLRGSDLSPSRLEYILIQTQNQAQKALEPFGYYSSKIHISVARKATHFTVFINVDKQQAVRVQHSHIALEGWAQKDRYLAEDLKSFTPKLGNIFNQGQYETSKLKISHRLQERGYFDADLISHRVSIFRPTHAADIDLVWDSGRRYAMGPTHFDYDYFTPGLFDPLVYWKEGDYYHEGRIDRLRESLQKLDYFRVIDIQPHPDQADTQGRVPVSVHLERAKRTVYTAGLSYGTETGPGVRLGVQRRYLNRRGHKVDTQFNFAKKRKITQVLYRIPAFHWLDGWYSILVRHQDEQTRYIDFNNLHLAVGRSGQINRYWNINLTYNLLREQWRYGDNNTYLRADHYQTSTLLFPEADANYINVDDPIFPRHGNAISIQVRSGLQYLGADTNFSQGQILLRKYQGIGPYGRLLLRGELGTSWISNFAKIPPSLRYFAGGSNSIRGYAFREVGPRTHEGFALGAKSVLTGAVEYEYYFHGGPFGMATFFDMGSAFNKHPDWHKGYGIGFRYRSPVGPIRVDIAHGIDHPDSAFQLYFDLGTNL